MEKVTDLRWTKSKKRLKCVKISHIIILKGGCIKNMNVQELVFTVVMSVY